MPLAALLIGGGFLAAALIAWRLGGAPEKAGSAIVAAWICADLAYHLLTGPSTFDRAEPFHVMIDLGELAGMGWLALHANRLWPIGCAAAQIVCMAGHLVVAVDPEGLRRAYWALTQIPGYLQAAMLLAGALAHLRRRARGREAASWRPAAPR